MSGGLVSMFRDKETVSACGVVCADNSTDSARSTFATAGESVIASVWPSLGLPVPTELAEAPQTAPMYHLMKEGRMPPPFGGLEHIEVSKLPSGDYAVRHR